MAIIKRLYIFILKSFLPLFAMTFLIVLFIVLMQFLWKYIDDLVGKGLSMDVIGELFFYAAVTFVPMVLPLAILLASLMTFGNLGEKFELTAMKASGVSLVKAMSPLIVLISIIAVAAFFFQNNVLPHAQVKMYTLLFSVKQKSPELEIPEGVFYDQIPGYNLFIESKNRETGMLHGMMIYDVSRGGGNATILLADSGRLAFTPDMRYLYLHLFQGEQFENLREQKSLDRNVPFRREEFEDKEVLIPFDANFNRLDESGMRAQYVGKNLIELRHTIDSVNCRLDSIGRLNAQDLRATALPLLKPETFHYDDAEDRGPDTVVNASPVKIDTLLTKLSPEVLNRVMNMAIEFNNQKKTNNEFRAMVVSEDKRTIRRHEIELIKKFTLSVACLVFFFIGAPLGAIIRKGGLGTPLVISVLLFLFYYIIDNTGYKLARDGHWVVWAGIWLSTFVLAPLGVYVTWKAMNDSSVFDADRYRAWIQKTFGLKVERKVSYKEIIINEISVPEAVSRLESLRNDVLEFIEKYSGRQSYKQYWTIGYDTHSVAEIIEELEKDVTYMTDCRDPLAVNKLMDYPVIRNLWLCSPARTPLLSKVLMWFFPFGFPLYIAGQKAQHHLKDELQRVAVVSQAIKDLLTKESMEVND